MDRSEWLTVQKYDIKVGIKVTAMTKVNDYTQKRMSLIWQGKCASNVIKLSMYILKIDNYYVSFVIWGIFSKGHY